MDETLEPHWQRLRADPFAPEPYRALRRIYMTAHELDKAWCVCHTLAFLKRADADELQFHERYKPRGIAKAKHVMTAESWARLVHPDEDRSISAVFGACWRYVAATHALPHKRYGIKRKQRRDLARDPLMFSKLFYYVAQVLDVPLPEVYLVEDNKPADIELANAIEKDELFPSFVVRPHALRGKSEREIAFVSARALTYMRPEYYPRLLLPTSIELEPALLSAIALIEPRYRIPSHVVARVQQYLPELEKRMPAQVREQLGAIVGRFLEAAPKIDLAAWGRAVEATSHRAGFVVCGDLEVAARAAAVAPVVADGPRAKDRIEDLVLYSISEELFAVRAQMGLTIAG